MAGTQEFGVLNSHRRGLFRTPNSRVPAICLGPVYNTLGSYFTVGQAPGSYKKTGSRENQFDTKSRDPIFGLPLSFAFPAPFYGF